MILQLFYILCSAFSNPESKWNMIILSYSSHPLQKYWGLQHWSMWFWRHSAKQKQQWQK